MWKHRVGGGKWLGHRCGSGVHAALVVPALPGLSRDAWRLPAIPPPARPHRAHLPKGTPDADELVDAVGRHERHGGERDAPPDPVGPEREDVVVVVEGLEVDDTHHNDKLRGTRAVGRDRRKGREMGRGPGGEQAGERGRADPREARGHRERRKKGRREEEEVEKEETFVKRTRTKRRQRRGVGRGPRSWAEWRHTGPWGPGPRQRPRCGGSLPCCEQRWASQHPVRISGALRGRSLHPGTRRCPCPSPQEARATAYTPGGRRG